MNRRQISSDIPSSPLFATATKHKLLKDSMTTEQVGVQFRKYPQKPGKYLPHFPCDCSAIRWHVPPSHATRGAYVFPRPGQFTVDRWLPSAFNFLRYSIPTELSSTTTVHTVSGWAVPYFQVFIQPTAAIGAHRYGNMWWCCAHAYPCLPSLIKQGIRRPKNKSFKEQEFRRARKSPKKRSGSKAEISPNMCLNIYLFQIKYSEYSFRADCRALIDAALENNRFFFAFFRKLVSFNGNIEYLSVLDAPPIDSVNWKQVAANNCFFLSGRLPVILVSHKPKMTTRMAHPPS